MSSHYLLLAVIAGSLWWTGLHADEFIDPTRPPMVLRSPGVEQKSPATELKLDTVLVSPGRRVAVINGNVLREGDEVGGATIEQIDLQGVVINRGGQQVTLRLGLGEIKKANK